VHKLLQQPFSETCSRSISIICTAKHTPYATSISHRRTPCTASSSHPYSRATCHTSNGAAPCTPPCIVLVVANRRCKQTNTGTGSYKQTNTGTGRLAGITPAPTMRYTRPTVTHKQPPPCCKAYSHPQHAQKCTPATLRMHTRRVPTHKASRNVALPLSGAEMRTPSL
jgi:hypothetical protein